jgi:ATP:cob(I)alamin adenosyltransferase
LDEKYLLPSGKRRTSNNSSALLSIGNRQEARGKRQEARGKRIMPISTKKGDKGFTGLLGGRRVPKHHLKPETYGTLDELDSFLGMARAVSRDKKVKKILFAIQNHFFIIGSELALSGKDRSLLKGEITQKEVDWLSQLSTDFEASLKPEPKFIIYGETLISSILDVARAVSRRAERRVAEMKSKKMLHNLKILEYLNRLSDVLYPVRKPSH